jgi:hypothetical protein
MCLGCATAEAQIAQAFGGRRFENKRGVKDQMKIRYALLAGMLLLGTTSVRATPITYAVALFETDNAG